MNGDGVMNLMITNPAADASAEFVVTNPATFVASVIDLGPGASQTGARFAGLPDGSVVVPVRLNGNDASVTTQVACDAPTCADGVLTRRHRRQRRAAARHVWLPTAECTGASPP